MEWTLCNCDQTVSPHAEKSDKQQSPRSTHLLPDVISLKKIMRFYFSSKSNPKPPSHRYLIAVAAVVAVATVATVAAVAAVAAAAGAAVVAVASVAAVAAATDVAAAVACC